jgi:hypothetical protein
MTRGPLSAAWSNWGKKRRAAQRSRGDCTRISMTAPFWSTARIDSLGHIHLAPFPDRFIRRWDAPLRHHLFDIPIAQGKAKVQPYSLLHNLDRQTVPAISALRRFHNASFSHFLVDDEVLRVEAQVTGQQHPEQICNCELLKFSLLSTVNPITIHNA